MMVHFDDIHISKSGKKIPLEHNGEPHQCPNSDYGKARETRTAGAAGIEQWAAIGVLLDSMNSKLDQMLSILKGQQTLEGNE